MGMSELQFQERKNMSQQERGRHFESPHRTPSKPVLFPGTKLMPSKEKEERDPAALREWRTNGEVWQQIIIWLHANLW